MKQKNCTNEERRSSLQKRENEQTVSSSMWTLQCSRREREREWCEVVVVLYTASLPLRRTAPTLGVRLPDAA